MQELIAEARSLISNEPSIAKYIAAEGVLRSLSADESELGDSRECVLERGNYCIRPLNSLEDLTQVSMLINDRYSWRGYCTDDSTPLPHKSTRIVLGAARGQFLFGTLTVGLDSDEGLLADALYKREIDAFRDRGCQVCDVSRFAIEPEHGSKDLLGSLFYVMYLYAHVIHKCTDLFAEVNPRHAGFYGRMLGLRRIGDVRICPRVDAPAVLLHIELAYMGEQIARHYGHQHLNDRSLYPYFLNRDETTGPGHRVGIGAAPARAATRVAVPVS